MMKVSVRMTTNSDDAEENSGCDCKQAAVVASGMVVIGSGNGENDDGGNEWYMTIMEILVKDEENCKSTRRTVTAKFTITKLR